MGKGSLHRDCVDLKIQCIFFFFKQQELGTVKKKKRGKVNKKAFSPSCRLRSADVVSGPMVRWSPCSTEEHLSGGFIFFYINIQDQV